MKLRNKKTGEIGWLCCDHISVPKKMTVFSEDKDLSAPHWDYTSLAELNADWKDYEEPKTFWFIDEEGIIRDTTDENWPEESVVAAKSIGNHFESKEEAERAVEKLKAWKRLKDKGFRFDGFYDKSKQHILWHCGLPYITDDEFYKDLDLLFGGEE